MRERIEFICGLIVLAILVTGLVAIFAQDANAATPDQIQTCSALAPSGYTGTALVGCPTANLGSGPKLTTDLVRTSDGTNQLWVPFNLLTPSSPVVLKSTGKWSTLASVTITPAPTTPAVTPPVVTPPPVPPPPVDVVISLDGQTPPLYVPTVYQQIAAGSCFTLTDGTHTAHACLQ